ncbi:MAG: hypothetical protein KDK27_15920, partial [Leptospiraceae bacterium]|nr:hypothetical protein [Leptospiraceae bacterium]
AAAVHIIKFNETAAVVSGCKLNKKQEQPETERAKARPFAYLPNHSLTFKQSKRRGTPLL